MGLNIHGESFPKNRLTTLAIRISVLLCTIFGALLLVLAPPKESGIYNWVSGFFLIFLGLGLFLGCVVETWQTRRSMQMWCGPKFNFDTHPVNYCFLLCVCTGVAILICFFGIKHLITAFG